MGRESVGKRRRGEVVIAIPSLCHLECIPMLFLDARILDSSSDTASVNAIQPLVVSNFLPDTIHTHLRWRNGF